MFLVVQVSVMWLCDVVVFFPGTQSWALLGTRSRSSSCHHVSGGGREGGREEKREIERIAAQSDSVQHFPTEMIVND